MHSRSSSDGVDCGNLWNKVKTNDSSIGKNRNLIRSFSDHLVVLGSVLFRLKSMPSPVTQHTIVAFIRNKVCVDCENYHKIKGEHISQ